MHKRYEDPKIARIFSADQTIERWFAVEVTHMGAIQSGAMSDCLRQVGAPELHQVQNWEHTTRHELVAFLHALDDRIQWSDLPEGVKSRLRQWLHYGLTSSDVTDTAMAMALRSVEEVLNGHLDLLHETLDGFIKKLGDGGAMVVGRTHGQLASPMPADHPWIVLQSMLRRVTRRAVHVNNWVAQGKVSGPVGVRSEPKLQHATMQRLGLVHCGSTTQIVPRDLLAEWANNMARLAQVCESIATQVWMLAQDGIAQLIEIAEPGVVGSSAMPHKVNPVRSENIRGLSRLATGYAQMLQAGVVQWGEHDLAHSSVERVALPDLCHVVAACLVRTNTLLQVTQSRPIQIPESYRDTHAELMELQRRGTPYVLAHEQLRNRDTYESLLTPLVRSWEEEQEATRSALGSKEDEEPY